MVLPDYAQIRKDYQHAALALQKPYFLCAGLLLSEAGLVMHETNLRLPSHRQAMLKPVFDTQEEYGGRVKEGFDGFAGKNPLAAKYLYPPDYENDKDYLTLQAADNFAYEVRKLLTHQRFQTPTRERIPMLRLKHESATSVVRLYKLDYQGLKTFADAQLADLQPVLNSSMNEFGDQIKQ